MEDVETSILEKSSPEMQDIGGNEARRQDIIHKSLMFHVAALRTSIKLNPDTSFFHILSHIYFAPTHGSSYFMMPSSIALICSANILE